MTLEDEKRFVILVSIDDLGGNGTKRAVLDNIQARDYLQILPEQRELKRNRNEQVWRNDLAFVRKHLVIEGHIDGSRRDCWRMTDKGRTHLRQLSEKVMTSLLHQQLTAAAVTRAEKSV